MNALRAYLDWWLGYNNDITIKISTYWHWQLYHNKALICYINIQFMHKAKSKISLFSTICDNNEDFHHHLFNHHYTLPCSTLDFVKNSRDEIGICQKSWKFGWLNTHSLIYNFLTSIDYETCFFTSCKKLKYLCPGLNIQTFHMLLIICNKFLINKVTRIIFICTTITHLSVILKINTKIMVAMVLLWHICLYWYVL